MVFELFCAMMIALLWGAVITFGGYRLFLTLLPIWCFFFGFALGAESLQLIFDEAFLATVTSWVAGFVVGVIFGLLVYLFYAVAVGVIAGSLGYALRAGFMNLIGVEFGFLVWLVGRAAGAVAILVAFRFALQKYAIIVATAVGGAGTVVITLMFGYIGLTLTKLVENPIQFALTTRRCGPFSTCSWSPRVLPCKSRPRALLKLSRTIRESRPGEGKVVTC